MDEQKVINELLTLCADVDVIRETMATKDDVRSMQGTLEDIVTIVKRLDQERIFTLEWVKRIEADVNKIKLVLKIA
ncbi:MAG: hypothetical protein Q8Q23_06660 [bacterium]|nr:hypothetical protein [bacterium]